jgi:hypothetical protein
MTIVLDGTNGITSPDVDSKLNGLVYPDASSMGFRNRTINGDMRIDQRNAGASFSPSNSGNVEYSVDRFGGARPSSGVAFTLQQTTDAPAGFVNSLRVTVPTGATPSGTQLSFVAQPIEGLNVSDLGWGSANAQTVTLSFWVKSSVTGSFPIVLVNSGTVRAYGATYTINAANTWEQKTVVVPGDTSGTWLTNNGVGIQVNWGLGGAGASRTVTTGWQTTSSPGSSVGVIAGTVNLVATTGATWQITGVQLEAGTVASPFERRDYGRELMMCQRYFQKLGGVAGEIYGCGYITSSGFLSFPITFPTMRASPTGAVVGTWAVSNVAQPTLSATSPSAVSIFAIGTVIGQGQFSSSSASTFITLSSEL